MEAKVYNQEGKVLENISLPKEVFGLSWNADLVHQVVVSMMSNARSNTAHTKMRGEVSGTGKKPWKQKGTGRARHGSMRSPIWVGGGVTHGPRNDKNYEKKINKKMRIKALFTVLSKKVKDGEVIFIDDLSVKDSKTKNAYSLLENLSKEKTFSYLTRKNRINGLMSFWGDDAKVKARSYKNLPQIEVCYTKNLNPVDILNRKYLILSNPKETLEFLSSKLN